MLKIRQLYLLGLFLTSKAAWTLDIHLQINGLSGNLKKNVDAQLSTIQNDGILLKDYLYNRIESSVRKGLKALGYYEPKINFSSSRVLAKNRKVLIVRVDPGEPIRIAKVNITLQGEALKDQEYLNLLNKQPSIGKILNHSDYDNFKRSLINIALRKGYFDNQFNKSQLVVIPSKHKAFWNIVYNSGYRYRFGKVTFVGSQIRDERLQKLVPFKKFDYFESKDLMELNRRLSSTGWFDSVVATPEFDKTKNKLVSVIEIVSPSVKNTVETGIGYSTDNGPYLKTLWKKPWINSLGHSLTANTNFSVPEKQLSFDYQVPMSKNHFGQYYLIQGKFKQGFSNSVKSNSCALSFSYYWNLTRNWKRAIKLQWSVDHSIANNITCTSRLLYSSITINRTRSNDNLMPTFGNFQKYSIDYSSIIFGSDVNFLVIQIQNAWVQTLYSRHRFFIRENLGWIQSNNLNKVPLGLRFFAGGDRSIRGYKYRSLSPRENDRKLINGASKLVTGSLEYQYNLAKKWWGSIFLDGGEAVNNIHNNNFKIGTGIGVYWESHIGPIKINFAIPIENKGRNLQFYIGLGPEL